MDSDVVSRATPLDRIRSGRWLFRLPMLGALGGQYEAYVRMYDRDLLGYFQSTPRIDGEDRAASLDAVTWLVERMNAQQGWDALTWRIKPVLEWLAVWPAPWVFGLGAWVLAWSPAPWGVKLGWALAAVVYMIMSFAVVFCAAENSGFGVAMPADLKGPRYSAVLGVALLASSVGTVAFGFSLGAIASAVGSLLIALPLTLALALALAATVDKVQHVRWRAAVFVAEIGALAALSTMARPSWPGWLVRGLWAGLWASTALAMAFGTLLIVAYLTTWLSRRWKNRRYAVEELVQTILWMTMRIDDADRSEPARTELSRQFVVPSAANVIGELEYLANLIERSIPRVLDCRDRDGNKAIADRCRGIAASVRGLKVETVLNQRSPLDRLATTLVDAIVPVALGDWNSLAYTDTNDRPKAPSPFARAVRWIGRVAAAIVPLTVVLMLQARLPGSGKLIDPLIPVAVTWLLVSVITWIDPGSGDRASSVKNLLGAMPGVKSN
jgi:hypothetical protein